MEKQTEKKRKLRPGSASVIPFGFLALILIGTLLLLLPISTREPNHTSFLTALFTSTTSVCVTGLVVVETASHWTTFGQVVILFLIQAGGLGIVAVFSAMLLALRKKMSLSQQAILRDSFGFESIGGLRRFLFRVLRGTFLIELIGSALYSIAFIPRFGVGKGIFVSIFTSVSAFCNAGLDIIGPDSLASCSRDPLVLTVTMVLIVLGGLGYFVWFDLIDGLRRMRTEKRSFGSFLRRLSTHSKLVVLITLVLVFAGAAAVFFFEKDNPDTIGEMTIGGKILNSFFQSVTFRTAGFATFGQEHLTIPSVVLGSVLMLIGGSPVGTAGGVKTVTVFLILAGVLSFIRNRDEIVVFKRRVTHEIMLKCVSIVAVSVFVVIAGTTALSALSGASLTDSLFETVSAAATVGLSRNLTPALTSAARIVVIFIMYLGRIGPISMALIFTGKRPDENDVRFALGRFFVG